MENEKIHFVLVHGGCHGAWCWYKLTTLLESAGYKVTTPDMGASGVDLRGAEDLKSLSEYSRPLMDLFESLSQEEKVILVGHSLGGAVISLAMERFSYKILVAVFVTAFMFGQEISLVSHLHEYYRRLGSHMDNKFFFLNGVDNPPTSFAFGTEFLSTRLYENCPPKVLTLAKTLVRPLFLLPDEIVAKDVVVSKEKFGSIRRVYIISEEDKIIRKDFQQYMIEGNPPDEVIEIKGSDHMVMLSKPQELYACLQGIAGSYS